MLDLILATAFSPESKTELTSAIADCLQISPSGDCPGGKYGPIGDWDVSRVPDMSYIFAEATAFDADISKWDVSGVTQMPGMFRRAVSFNADISNWEVSNVTNMDTMFYGATSFNADISDWDVSRVINMYYTFSKATSFNIDIGKWDVSNVNDMRGMFTEATSFNADISNWDVSHATNMGFMFSKAACFYQGLAGDAWVNSNAEKENMFQDSPGALGEATAATIPSDSSCPAAKTTTKTKRLKLSSKYFHTRLHCKKSLEMHCILSGNVSHSLQLHVAQRSYVLFWMHAVDTVPESVGIIAGATVFFIIIVLIATCCRVCYKRRKQREKELDAYAA